MFLTTLIVAATFAQDPPAMAGKAALQGTWNARSLMANGQAAPPQAVQGMVYTFEGDNMLIQGNSRGGGKRVDKATYKIDDTKTPKQFEFTPATPPRDPADPRPPVAPKPILGIYELKGDEVTFCFRHGSSTKPRPTEFSSEPGSEQVLAVFKKAAK